MTEVIDITNPPAGLAAIIGDSVFDGERSISSVGTDNSSALAALRDYCESDRTIPRIWYAPKGVYCYADNKWFPNIDHFEIIGTANSVFACTQSGAASGDINWTAGAGDIFRDVQRTSHSTYIPHMGYLFDTIAAGSQTIALSTPSQHSNFAVGNRIFLHGYNQQITNAGFPPNSRYFEWNTITGINTSTGVLTLEHKTKYEYRADWLYNAVSENGPAKVINLDRSGYKYPSFIKLKGIRIASNPNAVSATGLAMIAERVELDNVTHHGHLWPQQCRSMQVTGGYYESTDDLDKNAEHVEIDGIRSGSKAGAATGITQLTLRNSKFKGFCHLGARVQLIENNEWDLSDQAANHGGWLQDRQTTPVHSCVARNNRIVYPHEFARQVQQSALNEIDVTSSAAGEFKVDPADSGNYATLDIGSVITSSDGESSAVVTELGYDSTDLYVKHTGGITFTGTVYSSSFLHLDVDDSNVISGQLENKRTWKRNVFKGPSTTFSGTPNYSAANRRILTIPVRARLDKVSFTLKQASQSSDTNHAYMLLAKESSGDTATKIFAGNSKTSGDRVVVDVAAGSASWTSGWSNNSAAAMTTPIHFLELWIASGVAPDGGMSDPTYTNENELPVFELEISGSAIA